MKEMSERQALAEAAKRWGPAATVEFSAPRSEHRGRLARYTCRVSNGARGSNAIEGQGYSWREAFDDACLR
jgi:hypothetical protein